MVCTDRISRRVALDNGQIFLGLGFKINDPKVGIQYKKPKTIRIKHARRLLNSMSDRLLTVKFTASKWAQDRVHRYTDLKLYYPESHLSLCCDIVGAEIDWMGTTIWKAQNMVITAASHAIL